MKSSAPHHFNISYTQEQLFHLMSEYFCLWLHHKLFVLFPQRTYAERIRGEARKKWLQQIITAAETGGASIEPVYKAVFQALFKVGTILCMHML